MHDAAATFVGEAIDSFGLRDAPAVLDLGGRVGPTGSIHNFFSAKVRVVDISPGFGVDIIADAATWTPDAEYDVVLCTEVLEHAEDWADIVGTAAKALRPGGMFLATMASRDRPPHSALTGGPLEPGEYYHNISPAELAGALGMFSTFAVYAADGHFGNDDLYCWAVR